MLKLLLVRRGKLAAENVDVPFRVTRAVAAPRRRRVYRVNFRPRRHPTTLPTSSSRRRRRHKLIHIVKHARFRRRFGRPLFLALLFLARTFAAKKIRRILRDTRRERAARSPWFRSSAILLHSYLFLLLVFEFQRSQDPLNVVLFVLLFRTSAFFLVQIQFGFPFRFRHAGQFRLRHFPELLVVFFALVPAATHSYSLLLLLLEKEQIQALYEASRFIPFFPQRERREKNI